MIEELLFQLLNSLIIRIHLGFQGVKLLLDRRCYGTRILVGIVCFLRCKAGSDKQGATSVEARQQRNRH